MEPKYLFEKDGVEVFEVYRPRKCIKLDGRLIAIEDMDDALEALEGADGLAERAVIPKRLGDMLVEKGVADANSRGSYGEGEKFEQFKQWFDEIKLEAYSDN